MTDGILTTCRSRNTYNEIKFYSTLNCLILPAWLIKYCHIIRAAFSGEIILIHNGSFIIKKMLQNKNNYHFISGPEMETTGIVIISITLVFIITIQNIIMAIFFLNSNRKPSFSINNFFKFCYDSWLLDEYWNSNIYQWMPIMIKLLQFKLLEKYTKTIDQLEWQQGENLFTFLLFKKSIFNFTDFF